MDDVLSFCLLVVVECCGILSLCFFYFVHSVVNLLFYLAYTSSYDHLSAYSLYFLPSVLL